MSLLSVASPSSESSSSSSLSPAGGGCKRQRNSSSSSRAQHCLLPHTGWQDTWVLDITLHSSRRQNARGKPDLGMHFCLVSRPPALPPTTYTRPQEPAPPHLRCARDVTSGIPFPSSYSTLPSTPSPPQIPQEPVPPPTHTHLCHACEEGLLQQSLIQPARVEGPAGPVHKAGYAILLTLRLHRSRQQPRQLRLLAAGLEGLPGCSCSAGRLAAWFGGWQLVSQCGCSAARLCVRGLGGCRKLVKVTQCVGCRVAGVFTVSR